MRRFIILGTMFLAMGGMFTAYAQDRIVLRTGEVIEARVMEITPTEIRYRHLDHLDGPMIIVPTAEVVTIIFEDGRQHIVTAAPQQQLAVPARTIVDPGARAGSAVALNLLLGFGIGSYIQGDTVGGTIGLLADALAAIFIIRGPFNLVREEEEERWWGTTYSYRLPGSFWFGIVTLACSRIFQVVRPFTYANRFNIALSPAIGNDGQPALAAAVNFRF